MNQPQNHNMSFVSNNLVSCDYQPARSDDTQGVREKRRMNYFECFPELLTIMLPTEERVGLAPTNRLIRLLRDMRKIIRKVTSRMARLPSLPCVCPVLPEITLSLPYKLHVNNLSL